MNPITEEALCDVQAQLYALRIVVRAIVRTHPDPATLLSAWRDALAEAAPCNPVAPAGWRHSAYLADRMRASAEDWTAELIELAVPSLDSSPFPPFDPGATVSRRPDDTDPH